MGATSCNDYLEQEPPSSLTPENFYTSEDQVQAAANRFYQDILPGHGGWDYGTYTTDNNTDNQMSLSPDDKFGTGLWKVSNTNDDWSWGNVRNVNYQLGQIVGKYKAGQISGSDGNLRQYIGELYFFRAYAYFTLLQRFGDLPILTKALPDEESVLVAADKREPCNEVARFIISDLDTALTYMPKTGFATTRVTYDAVNLFKSRVALYEGSWLTNFAGTPFVPNGTGWPGASKNAGYQYPSGSIEAEAKYFFTTAAEAAEQVAEKYKGNLSTNTGMVPQSLDDPANPYLNIWGSTDDSKVPDVILWRQYSKSLGIKNDVEVAVEKGNIGTGFTRSLIESYLMKDGKPIYASQYEYVDTSLNKVRTNRDPRLSVFLKAPGDINCFKNVDDVSGDHWTRVETVPAITNTNAEDGYITGYTIRKGMTFDRALTANGGSYNVCVVFRATEALLNYMEAEYMLTKSLSGKVLEYWEDVRRAAGFTGEAVNPLTTINATDMSKETRDWGAYTAGQLLSDKVLYNIRRERRCELIAEGLRGMDLQRWRSYDQLMKTPAHTEGIHLWGTPMEKWYNNLVANGSNSSNVSSPELSAYLRPHEKIKANNSFFNGLTWHMAHYLEPLPIRQFLLTASDHATVSESPLYQNPYWPTTPDAPAEQ
jgi:hypothetical protein